MKETSRRDLFRTFGKVAAGGAVLALPLMSDESPAPAPDTAEQVAFAHWNKLGNELIPLIHSVANPTGYLIEASTGFAFALAMLSTESKVRIEQQLRYGAWENEEARIEITDVLDYIGLDEFLADCARRIHPSQIRYPPAPPKQRQAQSTYCGSNFYYDSFAAGVGVAAAGLGVAGGFGCVPCGAVAMGMGLGMAFLRMARTIACK